MNRWTPEQARTRIRSALLELLEPTQLYESDGHNRHGRARYRPGRVMPDLLTMLGEAATPSRAAGDGRVGSASFESRPPTSIAAVTAWDTIRRQALAWSIELTGAAGTTEAADLRAEAARIQRSRNHLQFDQRLVEAHIGVLVQVLVEITGPVQRRTRVYLTRERDIRAELARYEQRSADLTAAIATCDELLLPIADRIAQLDGPRSALLAIAAVLDHVDGVTLARLDRAVTGGDDGDAGWLRTARVAVGLDPDPVTMEHPCPYCARRNVLTVAIDDDGPRAWCNGCGTAWPSHLVPLLVAQVDAVRASTSAEQQRAEQLDDIRARMDAAGLSRQSLADALGTSRPYVSQVLGGVKVASDATLKRMRSIVDSVAQASS